MRERVNEAGLLGPIWSTAAYDAYVCTFRTKNTTKKWNACTCVFLYTAHMTEPDHHYQPNVREKRVSCVGRVLRVCLLFCEQFVERHVSHLMPQIHRTSPTLLHTMRTIAEPDTTIYSYERWTNAYNQNIHHLRKCDCLAIFCRQILWKNVLQMQTWFRSFRGKMHYWR